MRIITGKYKGKFFPTPTNFKARPTTDFAKENLFNILRQELNFEQTEALDLFAGTGSISLELLSRGCSRVVSIEIDVQHFKYLKQIQKTLQDPNWSVVRQDALRIAQKGTQKFDFIFADPPYALPSLPKLPQLLLNSNLLKSNALIVVEHSSINDFSTLPEFLFKRSYGSVNFSFFQKK